ncbi:MAG TPA: hypothetical protein EYH25_03335, partial [Thermotoga sp.]|nr:hypothetical protein [Thermotoga sp.]
IRTKDIILKEALNKLEKEKEKLAFLSLFDFSVTQMERIMKIIDRKGFKTIKMNPYLLVEEYTYDQKEHWNWDESDSGIGIYHIDIALIPDRNYANWNFDGFDATTPQRIRAIISNILHRAAFNHGNTYLTRKEIIEEIRKYTLYYIGEELDIKESKLKEYESLEIFREKFIIDRDPETGEVIYQLKSIRKLEEKIENVIKTMLKKTYTIGPDAEDFIRKAVTSDLSKVQIKINKEVVRAEREKVYRNALKKGLLIISGRAGTGKTQAIVNLIKYFRNNTRGKIFVFSPTGKSNLVIRNRLREFGLHNDSMIKVSTIHRFLYGGVIDTIEKAGFSYSKDIRILYSLITQILDGKVELFEKFEKFARRWRLSPSVVIIDEASMVDELILAVLFAMINEQTLEHLIIVGDEKQLPPIGIGRPFLDIISFLKKNGYNDNIVYLKTNLRFPSDSLLGKLSSIFAEDEKPTIKELEQLCAQKDDTMEIIKFKDMKDLKRILRKILMEILGVESSDKTLSELFKDIFNREKNMEFVQILTPRRVGDFGTLSLNLNVIMEGNPNIIPGSKLICEENIYIDVERYGRRQRVLGLANGSIGYLKDNGDPGFREIEDIFSEYGRDAGIRLVRRIREEIENPLKTDRIIDFAYAITVHKSQGSDFDYVILVLKDVTSFITKELIYTALTRAKRKLYILVHEHLAEKLPLILWEIYDNSAIEKIKTMLFSAKRSPFRPYLLELRDGKKIALRSKIEYIIARTLDKFEIEFEYEPDDFKDKGIYPDFRINVNGEIYYWEHLGRLDERSYRERWLRKLEIYKALGLEDRLITTSESEIISNPEENIKQIIQDLKNG